VRGSARREREREESSPIAADTSSASTIEESVECMDYSAQLVDVDEALMILYNWTARGGC